MAAGHLTPDQIDALLAVRGFHSGQIVSEGQVLSPRRWGRVSV